MAGMWELVSNSQLEKTFELAQRVLRYGKSDPVVLATAATVLGLGNREHEASLELCREALRIAPFHPLVLASTDRMEVWSGELESAIEHLEMGVRLFPYGAGNHDILTALAAAHLYAGKYQSSLRWAQRAHIANSNHAPALRYQAACFAQLGFMTEARSAMKKCLALQPHCTVSIVERSGSLQARDPNMLAPYVDGLRLAGMSEA